MNIIIIILLKNKIKIYLKLLLYFINFLYNRRKFSKNTYLKKNIELRSNLMDNPNSQVCIPLFLFHSYYHTHVLNVMCIHIIVLKIYLNYSSTSTHTHMNKGTISSQISQTILHFYRVSTSQQTELLKKIAYHQRL